MDLLDNCGWTVVGEDELKRKETRECVLRCRAELGVRRFRCPEPDDRERLFSC